MNIPDALLDDWGRTVLSACRAAWETTRSRVYLVGGPVRDILRGVAVGDLDLAVQENENDFASRLAAELGATLTTNDRFLTWRLNVDSGRHLDLARLRTETYPSAGALPVVSPARSIEDDLARRDFTVNAMAIRLNDGTLVDPFDGRADLAAGRLRVLHPASFLDDPTRIFRAIRLSTRCSLLAEPATSTLLDEAVRSGAITSISRERLWKEIDLALGEVEPVPVLRALVARGCLEPLFGPTPIDNLSVLPDNLSIPGHLDARVVLLGALTRTCPDETFAAIPFDRGSVARIRSIAQRSPRLADTLALSGTSDARFAACETASAEERFLASLDRPDLKDLLARFDRALAIARTIPGDELGTPPGPWIGRAIRDTARHLFAGTVDQSAARAFASRLAMQYLEG